MKEITKIYEGYEFLELEEEAKNKVRSWHSETLHYEWWDSTYDWFVEKMEIVGIDVDLTNSSGKEDPQIFFSGFYTQGSGASFAASIDILKFMRAHNLIKLYWKLYRNLQLDNCWLSPAVSVSPYNYYSHSGGMQIGDHSFVYDNWDQNDDDDHIELLEIQAEKLTEDILQICTEYADDLYNDLEKEYEYLISDKSIEEMCDANECYFTEHGSLI